MRLPRSTSFRRIAVPLLAAVGLTLSVANPALAHTPRTTSSAATGTYLALGDSVPFGYYRIAQGTTEFLRYLDPTNFVGYPHYVAAATGLSLINASCPGETTDSFIYGFAAQSNGCENSLDTNGNYSPLGYRVAFPLHDPYGRATLLPQLQYALTVLKTSNVRLITIQLGANDGFLCQENNSTTDRCASPAEIGAVAQHVRANLDYIIKALRTEGHYTGRIVVVDYYALDYSDAQGALGTGILNGGIDATAIANHASIASGFLAFLFPSLRYGGNTINAGLVRPGDVHPTDTGQRILARAVEAALRF